VETNERQATFYDATVAGRGNLFTKVWRAARNAQQEVRAEIGVDRALLDLHRRWLGDLTGKRVLDLGCGRGNVLSLEIAARSDSYLGIDLSKRAIDHLRGRLGAAGLRHANAESVDFLRADFAAEEFDVIYAYSVAHHFKHLGVLLQKLDFCLRPGGAVVTFDPLQTSASVRVARAIYRPFQSDSAWEWPFTTTTLDTVARYFRIEHIQGLMGRAKWTLAVAPFSRRCAIRLGRLWHEIDLREARKPGRGLWRCMQIAMCWRKV
jgi:2-polyprenyl-3-methyl-5-hydroxy-6-metoxy-1,4-benzoquinol methylase